MDPSVMHDLTPAYALDALEDDERRAYEEHLRTCERCQEELAGLTDAAASLAYGQVAPEPPLALRERLLEGLEERDLADVVPLWRRRTVQSLAAAATLATAAAIGLGIWAGSLSSSLDDERVLARENTAVLELVGDPTTTRIALDGADGTLLVSQGGTAALVLSSLARAPAGMTYEVWVIRDGVAAAAGLFEGGSELALRLEEPVAPGTTVAVTLEAAGGVEQPTSTPLFSAAVA